MKHEGVSMVRACAGHVQACNRVCSCGQAHGHVYLRVRNVQACAGMHRHAQTVQETPGMCMGMGKWMKVYAVAWVCAAMDKGMRVHEMWPRVQVRHRRGCAAVDGMGYTWCG